MTNTFYLNKYLFRIILEFAENNNIGVSGGFNEKTHVNFATDGNSQAIRYSIAISKTNILTRFIL